MKYNKRLIDDCKTVFKEENDIDLSNEKAIEFLDSLGGLYLVFCKKEKRKS